MFGGAYQNGVTIKNHIVYIVDVSGSTEEGGADCNADGTIDTRDDFNGDGVPGTTLDCEIAGVVALNSSLRANSVPASLIAFGDNAALADMSPASGDQSDVDSNADNNNNRVPDVQDVAASLGTGALIQFTNRGDIGSNTSFAAPLERLKDLIVGDAQGADQVRYTVYFLSDGIADFPQSDVADLAAIGSATSGHATVSVNTVSVGAEGAGCSDTSPLQQVSAGLSGTCTAAAPSQLQATLGESQALGLDHIDVSFAGGTTRASVDAVGHWTASFANVAASTTPYPYIATAVRTDGTTSVVTGSVLVAVSMTVHYVGLGDSYSSGNGLVPYLTAAQDPNGVRCARSVKASAYAVRLPDGTSPSLQLSACASAQTVDVVGRDQFGADAKAHLPAVPPQLNDIGPGSDLITLTIGGDDAYFSEVLKACALNHTLASLAADCEDAPFMVLNSGRKLTLDQFATLRLTLLQADLLDTLRRIRAQAPNATVVVADYPHLISADAPGNCAEKHLFRADERTWIRTKGDELSADIQLAAKQAGVYFTSVVGTFAAHELCGTGTSWLYGIEVGAKDDAQDAQCQTKTIKLLSFTVHQTYCLYGRTFHPTADGEKAYGGAFSAELKAAQKAPVNGLNPSGLPRNPTPQSTATLDAYLGRTGTTIDPRSLTPVELAEIRGFTADDASIDDLSTVQNLAWPAACGSELRADPGQLLVVSGDGFKAGSKVTPSVQLGQTPFTLAPVTADSNGAVVAPVLLPTGTSPAPAATFALAGIGTNGHLRMVLSSLADGTGDDACVAAQRQAGLLSVDGLTLPPAAAGQWSNAGVVRLAKVKSSPHQPVVAPAPAPPSTNPHQPGSGGTDKALPARLTTTGPSLRWGIVLGALLILVGAALIVLVRRRTRTS